MLLSKHRTMFVGMVLAGLTLGAASRAEAIDPPTGLIAEGHGRHIDLVWDRVADDDQQLWNVYRAEQATGPWEKLNDLPHTIHVYSDFTGEHDQTFHYRVTRLEVKGLEYFDYLTDMAGGRRLVADAEESDPSPVVVATTVEQDEDAFLDSMQRAFLRYFWEFGHPVSGLAREGFTHRRHITTTGGTGFGMMTIMVGADRGLINRQTAAERLLKMVRFLEDKATRYHGIWSHHLRGGTGETVPFAGKEDNGGDIVESAFLMEGMLTVREYFDGSDPMEIELRERITRLWREAEWSWYLQPGDNRLTWHWSPDYGFKKNHKFDGFNECMMAYLLAMASPTHAIPADKYYLGWAGRPETYVNGNHYYGIRQPVGRPMGGPLFFTHYSYLGLDPRELTDAYTNYFENNRAISLINRAYCSENPRGHEGYSQLVWGLTSSQNPNGYGAHQPGSDADNGTIAPTAAISAMPYTPQESLATLRHFYDELGPSLWGPFGFHDAFNPGADWVSLSFLAIDQGPMGPMIENHRTGLPWRMFMQSDVAAEILHQLEKARPAALSKPRQDAQPNRP